MRPCLTLPVLVAATTFRHNTEPDIPLSASLVSGTMSAPGADAPKAD